MTLKTPSPSTLSYRPAPGLRSSVEIRGLSFYTAERGVFCCLAYPFAALWDLFQRGYDEQAASELFRHIAGVEAAEAQQMLSATAQQWVALGLLVQEEKS